MLHIEFWGLLFLGFVFWVVLAANPSQRIENFCRPVGWTGNIVTSLSALVLADHEQKIQRWFGKLEYGCQYTTWRLFYQEAYNKYLEQQNNPEGAASSASSPDKKESSAQ